MALPATATFTGTDGTDLATADTNFVSMLGSQVIRSNRDSTNNSGADNLYRWQSDTFANDQYAFITVDNPQASHFIGPSVRVGNSGVNSYTYYVSGTQRFFFKFVGGTATDLVAPAGTGAATNDLLRIEANGTTITAFRNGSQDGAFTATDSSLTSGWGGVSGFGSSVDTAGDNWEAGNLGSIKRMMLLGVG